MYHISKFNFGFEYETLVETKNELFKPWVACKKNTKDDKCSDIDKNSKNIFRYALASYLNYKSNSNTFKARINNEHAAQDCLPKDLLKLVKTTKNTKPLLNNNVAMINTKQPVLDWVVTHDGSVVYDETTMYRTLFENPQEVPQKSNFIENIEIVSPKLSFADIINPGSFENIINTKMRAENTFDFWNCKHTSNHAHFSCGDAFKNPNNLLKAAMAWWYFEPVFFLMVAGSRRKNEYCKSIHSTIKSKIGNTDTTKNTKEHFRNLVDLDALRNLNISINLKDAVINQTIIDLMSIIVYFQNGVDKLHRYNSLNLLNIIGATGTIEVRLKHGSSDAIENKNWLLLLGYFFSSVLQFDCISKGATPEFKEAAWTLNEEFEKFDKTTRLDPQQIISNFLPQTNLTTVVNFMLDNFWRFLSISAGQTELNELKAYFNNHMNHLHTTHLPPTVGGSKPSKLNYLFSYGSNSTKQIKNRIKRKGGPLEIQPAYLADHIRIFAGYSKKWSGAVASVYPQSRKNVYGSLVKISKSELELLDGYEKGYTRVRKTVTIQDDIRTNVEAFVYVKNDVSYDVLPSIKYLKAISDTLKETDRKHKDKIMIRVINPKTDRSTILGRWTPTDGMVINHE